MGLFAEPVSLRIKAAPMLEIRGLPPRTQRNEGRYRRSGVPALLDAAIEAERATTAGDDDKAGEASDRLTAALPLAIEALDGKVFWDGEEVPAASLPDLLSHQQTLHLAGACAMAGLPGLDEKKACASPSPSGGATCAGTAADAAPADGGADGSSAPPATAETPVVPPAGAPGA